MSACVYIETLRPPFLIGKPVLRSFGQQGFGVRADAAFLPCVGICQLLRRSSSNAGAYACLIDRLRNSMQQTSVCPVPATRGHQTCSVYRRMALMRMPLLCLCSGRPTASMQNPSRPHLCWHRADSKYSGWHALVLTCVITRNSKSCWLLHDIA